MSLQRVSVALLSPIRPRGTVPAPWQSMPGWWCRPPPTLVCSSTEESTLSSRPGKRQTPSLVTQTGEEGGAMPTLDGVTAS